MIVEGEKRPRPVPADWRDAARPRGAGAALAAGEVNLTGPLLVRVTAAGRDSSLSRMAALVAMAEAGRGRFRTLSDRAVRFYTPFVHACAALTFLWWMGTKATCAMR